ncbi:MAG: PTS sugar transporter subunit IIA [Oscillospiraceae bacterium]|nr:PTS sugar transporter subunit IIA [Oscillospiraceae bacterium]
MKTDYFAPSRILTGAQAADLDEAVRLCGSLLVSDQKAAPGYPAAMLDTMAELGPYAVMAPGVAVPHARPDKGGLAPAAALVFLKTPVPFESPNGPVKIIAGFCGADDDSHMAVLSAVVSLLSDRQRLDRAAQCATPEEAAAVINGK